MAGREDVEKVSENSHEQQFYRLKKPLFKLELFNEFYIILICCIILHFNTI